MSYGVLELMATTAKSLEKEEQAKEAEIAAQSKDETDGRTLRQVVQLTLEKAMDEAHWAFMYAKLCKRILDIIPFDGDADFFSAIGHRPYNSGGAPHQNQHLGRPPLSV
jgi:hypothetical protein